MAEITDPGYFRIGAVVLQIPPIDISTNKIVNDDQVATLRSSTSMFIKSGQARWDVTVHWKAIRLVQQDGSFDYTQWSDLRKIVATFKASPFVEVENDFLRQHFTNIQQAYKTQRMAFALKQLRVDTNPDTVDVIDVTLTMSLFNYSPFSIDFAYIGGDDNSQQVDAIDSAQYNFFLNHWIDVNMNTTPSGKGEPDLMPWDQQEEGTMSFKWRKYLYMPFNSPPPPPVNQSTATSPVVPNPRVPTDLTKRKLSADVQSIISTTAAKYGLDPNIIASQCLYESRGNPNAVSPTGAIGLMQLLPSTARGLGVQNPFDPQQNVDGGCKYMAQQLKKFGNYPHALGAYNAGAGYIISYRDGKPIKTNNGFVINPQGVKTPDGLPPAGTPHGENVPLYVSTILTNAKKANLLTSTPAKGSGVPPTPAVSTTVIGVPNTALIAQLNLAIAALPSPDLHNIWLLDHYSELGAYFYQDEEIFLAGEDASFPSDYDLFPVQISVVMVNNLPVIPMAGMQYPTYQHVGPTDTMISINMSSVGGESDVLNEPEHEGIQALASMSSQLEDQFHKTRTFFRAVSSIHRMQAVFIENQILNMLGIRGTMLRGLNTETNPEMVNTVQVGVVASQYENIFEQSTPFRINGVTKAYKSTLQSILTGGDLDKTSSAEQNSYQSVKLFSDAWQKRDPAFLLNAILKISTAPLDFLSDTSTPDAGISPNQKSALLSGLDIQNGVGGFFNASLEPTPIFQKDTYPGLEKRRGKLQDSSTGMTYADYFVFTQLPVLLDTATISSIRNTVESKFAAQKSDIIDSMYQRLFDYKLMTDPVFSRQTSAITNSPAFANRFAEQMTVQGPALQDENAGHFCYKDLGLTDYRQNAADYFFNHNEALTGAVTNILDQTMATTSASSTAVNDFLTSQAQQAQASGDTARAKQLQAFGTSGFSFSGHGQEIPGGSAALTRMLNVPAYSMNTAFPTFKLFLIEEDNTGPFFAFDNFYSYASVIDIEVIKYQDKPDEAVIQITNLAHVLEHRLYDDTAAGKLEASDDNFNFSQTGGVVAGGPNVNPNEAGTGGNPSSGVIASKTAAGTPYQKKNLAEGVGETYSRIPLQFFALQTGSKIQVRMGYSNNPDNLFPVFTGQVTEIEGDEILTITCQSFQLELMNVPGTTVIANSRWGLNFLSGAAMGGWSLSNAGDTRSVIDKMLTSEAARHFGHWQIGQQVDPLLKGFSWLSLGGQLLSSTSNPTLNKVGALLQTGYDRSGENILINTAINFDASKPPDNPANAGRRQFDDYTSNLQYYLGIGTASYYIPKQSEASVWNIIKDVSRRYPHYNLMVKDYGFPYEADATLIYAHPLDWYYRRPPLYGDAEKEKPSNITQGQQFQQWWNSVGKAKWNEVWAHAADNFRTLSPGRALLGLGISNLLVNAQAGLTGMAGSGPEGFVSAIQQIHGILTGTTVTAPATDVMNKFFNVVQDIQNVIVAAVTSGNITGRFYQNLDSNFQDLLREWEIYLVQAQPAANSSRIAPVRKYHLIDFNHIVHNGIKVNDNIYNAIKILDHNPIPFNQNIPGNHIKLLNVTDQILDPEHNCSTEAMKDLYAQSFLKEEVGKMYRGELVIRGVAEIEPMDIILLNDPSTGTVGPIEVDTVIHSFNMENGYITIIKPRLHLIANESVSVSISCALGFAWANAMAELHSIGYVFKPTGPDSTISGTVSGVVGALALGATVAVGIWLLPLGVIAASLALLSGYGLLTWLEKQATLNMFKMQPLSKFGRPWIGGLQGFRISDFAYSVMQDLKHFDAEEIRPTIESWHELLNYQVDYLQGQQ